MEVSLHFRIQADVSFRGRPQAGGFPLGAPLKPTKKGDHLYIVGNQGLGTPENSKGELLVTYYTIIVVADGKGWACRAYHHLARLLGLVEGLRGLSRVT